MRKLNGQALNAAIKGFHPHRTQTQWLRGRRIPAMRMTEHMLAFTAALHPRMYTPPANTDHAPSHPRHIDIKR